MEFSSNGNTCTRRIQKYRLLSSKCLAPGFRVWDLQFGAQAMVPHELSVSSHGVSQAADTDSVEDLFRCDLAGVRCVLAVIVAFEHRKRPELI